MLLLQILLVIIGVYALLWLLVPKGSPLYEGLRLPVWLLKMEVCAKREMEKKTFAYGKHPRQYVVLYHPVGGATDKRHVVVYLHGGGWQFGRPEMFRPNAQALVERGYWVLMPSHRRIPFFGIKKQREDLALAFAKIVEIMRDQGHGEKKILLGGMSSGANLAGLLAFDRSLALNAGVQRDIYAGFFLLGAPVNLHGMWKSPPLWALAGSRKGERFRLANPIDHLQPDDLPLLLLHSERDGLVEFKSIQAFFEKTQELGFRNVEFRTLPSMTHMDAASWCFESHPSHQIVMGWLEKMEKLAENNHQQT